jgi:LuxR family quorum-sensing system transcriptional regulator ExpR
MHERYLVFNSLSEKNPLYSDKKIQFTHRENEIFYWASIGKTYHEIGIILAIKTSTIKFHMGNIIKKLDVNNARHAIRLGMELQLIKPMH